MMDTKLMASIWAACDRKRCARAEKALTRRWPDESNYLDVKRGCRLTDPKGLAQRIASVSVTVFLSVTFLTVIPLSSGLSSIWQPRRDVARGSRRRVLSGSLPRSA